MRILFLLILLSMVPGCVRSTATVSEDNGDIIRHVRENGESGYHSGIEIQTDYIYYSFSSLFNEPENGVLAISAAERQAIWELVDIEALDRLAASLKCYICSVDGSSDSIVIETADKIIIVQMDAGLHVPEIADLLEKLREIREQFEAEFRD